MAERLADGFYDIIDAVIDALKAVIDALKSVNEALKYFDFALIFIRNVLLLNLYSLIEMCSSLQVLFRLLHSIS